MRLGGWKLPLDHVSASSLSTAITCPEQFRRKYLLGEEEVMFGDAFIGSVMHLAIERAWGPGMKTPEETFEEAWKETLDRRGEPDWREDDPVELFKRMKLATRVYWATAQQVAKESIATEQRFEETILGVKVVGYIDREMRDRILDVKTAKQKVSKPKPKWMFQGRLYSLVVQKPIEWHIITKQATPQVFTAENAPDLYVPSYNPDGTIAILERALTTLNDLYARYGKDNPWPMDGIFHDWLCSYCSYKENCPAHAPAQVS